MNLTAPRGTREPRSTRRARRTALAALATGAAVVSMLGVGPVSAQASPPKPTFVSQVPFVVPGSPDAGVPIGERATIWGVPSTVNAGDIIAWATCDGTRVPSAYPVTKALDHSTRRMLLTLTIDSGRTDRNCVLNAVPTALSTHIAFFDPNTDPHTGAVTIDGEYIVDGITAG